MLAIPYHIQKTGWFIILLFAFAFLMFSCHPKALTPETEPEAITFNKLLIMPFKDMYRIYGDNVSFRCPLCEKVYMIEEVAPEADDFLTEQLIDLMKTRNHFELLPSEHAREVMSSLLSKNGKEQSELELLLETGRLLGADAIMMGRIYRFKKRIGTEYAVESPASVTFDLVLINVADGRILWSGYFDETQQSLFENLLHFGKFLERKGKWITAEQMAASGLEDLLQKFPES
jgi:hypothetical protein